MKTFLITSLGCKVNQYESREIARTLIEAGLKEVADAKSADLAIVHTCCVTHTASSKSRQMLRKHLKAANGCKVIATGCLPDAGKQEINGIDEDVIFISKKADLKAALLEIIGSSKTAAQNCPFGDITYQADSRTINARKIKDKNALSSIKNDKILNKSDFKEKKAPFNGQSRALLKIQDGCDGFCSYCIIPTIRTNVHSRNEAEIIAEAKQLVATGYKEIVLTGIFLGAYGQSTVRRRYWDLTNQNKFVAIVDKVAAVEGLKRLRLSSLEPSDVTEDLLNLFKKHENLAPHLHLSLQSGSSRVLKKMNRQYDSLQFRDCIDRVKAAIDRPAITTDIIVGFPCETDDDFMQTIEMAEFAKFSKIHVFSFSRRKNTAADKMKEQIPPQIIKHRSLELSELAQRLQWDFKSLFAGEKISVIIENAQKQTGLTERYFEVQIAGGKLNKGDFVYAVLQDDCKRATII